MKKNHLIIMMLTLVIAVTGGCYLYKIQSDINERDLRASEHTKYDKLNFKAVNPNLASVNNSKLGLKEMASYLNKEDLEKYAYTKRTFKLKFNDKMDNYNFYLAYANEDSEGYHLYPAKAKVTRDEANNEISLYCDLCNGSEYIVVSDDDNTNFVETYKDEDINAVTSHVEFTD